MVVSVPLDPIYFKAPASTYIIPPLVGVPGAAPVMLDIHMEMWQEKLCHTLLLVKMEFCEDLEKILVKLID